MIVAIDGTGPDSDVEYLREMGGSFCNQICTQAPKSKYFRGPTLTGSETSAIADRAVDAVLALRSGGGEPLMLAGYSRGGCAAILTAKRLKDRGLSVHSLFLFDAVDMQVSTLGLSQIIPDNVERVAHARSARSLKFWARNPVKSRFYFYNTGRWLAGSGHREERSFVGTHGAVGGVPWADVSGDGACVLAVAEWMNKQFADRGLGVTLKSL